MTEVTPEGMPPDEDVGAAPSRPQETPPGQEAAMAEVATAMPREAPTAEAVAKPSGAPPAEEEGVGEASGAVWHRGQKITALWSINQNRNCWIRVPGLDWKQLADNSDLALVALTIVASHAKLTGGKVNIKEESGTITEIYAW